MELKRRTISSPRLTMEDYERLEAEQFRYKLELTTIENECTKFQEQRDKLLDRIKKMPEKMIKINVSLENCEKMLMILKYSIKLQLEERKIWLGKLADAKHFIRNFDEIIGSTNRPEFATRMSKIRKEHEEWMNKISHFLNDIKNLGQSLNSLRASLILHTTELDKITSENGDKPNRNSGDEKNSSNASQQ